MIKNWWFIIGHCSLVLFSVFPFCSYPQTSKFNVSNYSEIFNPDYQNAIALISSNQFFSDSLKKWGIEPDFALAIVFPEVLRFSAIRDWAETKSLEVLYTQYGDKYADFSIGYFQMKPSFAAEIEDQWNLYLTRHPSQIALLHKFQNFNTEQSRYQRIKRLSDKIWQLRYLAIFYFLMDEKYNHINWQDKDARLLFYATAFNTGFRKNKEIIEKHSKGKAFHTKIIKPSVCYNYGEIAVDYYRNSCSHPRR
jgi:hypothetical protein